MVCGYGLFGGAVGASLGDHPADFGIRYRYNTGYGQEEYPGNRLPGVTFIRKETFICDET
jgi:hypothetical protein